MTTHPFPEWKPDASRLNPGASVTIKNVVPNADGYGPLNSIAPFSDALPGPCRGAKLAISADGTAHVFAGVRDGLFKMSSSSWADVSGPSAPYSLLDGHSWSFATFGEDFVIGTQISDPIQVYQLGVSTDFADIVPSGDAPPQARYVWTESGFLDVGHLENSPRAVQRSGYKDHTFWTVGHRGADREILSDGGLVAGAASDETGAFVFQDRAVRRLQNRPGEEVSFALSEVESTRGTIAPNSIVQVGNMIEFLAEDGFYRLGQPSTPIGAERIDRTFLDDINLDELNQVQGVADPVRKMNWWRYSSVANASLDYTDKLIGHHWYLDRWVYAEMNLEWLLPAALPGYTLEEMETILGYATLEAIPYSLDSRIWKGGRPAFAAFDSSHKLGFFEGPALEALLDTADIPIGGEGRRTMVNGFRPVGDVAGAFGRFGTKETLHGTPTFTDESAQNVTGLIPRRASGRTVRARLRIPAGTDWTHISGIEIPPEVARSAGRR